MHSTSSAKHHSANHDRYDHSVAEAQGSVIAVANPSGQALAIDSYDAAGAPGQANLGRYGYTGQAWIPEAGLYTHKARYYSPTLNRFLTTDPIGYADGPNWYGYVHGDPVNGTDPTGLAAACGSVGNVPYTDADGNVSTVPGLTSPVTIAYRPSSGSTPPSISSAEGARAIQAADPISRKQFPRWSLLQGPTTTTMCWTQFLLLDAMRAMRPYRAWHLGSLFQVSLLTVLSTMVRFQTRMSVLSRGVL